MTQLAQVAHRSTAWWQNLKSIQSLISPLIWSSQAETIQLVWTKEWPSRPAAKSQTCFLSALSDHRHVAAAGTAVIGGGRSSHTGEVGFISLDCLRRWLGGIKLSCEPTPALITTHKGSSLWVSIHSASQPEMRLPYSTSRAWALFVIKFTAYQFKDNKDKAARDLTAEVEEIYASSCSLIAASRAA